MLNSDGSTVSPHIKLNVAIETVFSYDSKSIDGSRTSRNKTEMKSPVDGIVQMDIYVGADVSSLEVKV